MLEKSVNSQSTPFLRIPMKENDQIYSNFRNVELSHILISPSLSSKLYDFFGFLNIIYGVGKDSCPFYLSCSLTVLLLGCIRVGSHTLTLQNSNAEGSA